MVRNTRLQVGLMLAGALIAGCLIHGLPCAVAATSTVPGTAVTIAPLDDFGKTVDDQVIETWVKVLGVVLIVGGALGMLRAPAIGVLGVVAGLLIIFANPIIEATFTTTSAAPLVAPVTTPTPIAVPVALRPMLVLLFYPMLLLRMLPDMTFWLALAISMPLVRRLRLRSCARSSA
jgi:hypothetical protein